MFSLGQDLRFSLYLEATDMRKSFDGLSGLVTNELNRDPSSGEVFIFVNKRKDRVKLLRYVGGSFVLYYKRLEKGNFELPKYNVKSGSVTLKYTQLVLLVDGLSIKNISRRKTYTQKPINTG
jgi:transposase